MSDKTADNNSLIEHATEHETDGNKPKTIEQFATSGIKTCRTRADNNDLCPICFEPYTSPIVTIACNHIFDRECLLQWLRSSSKPLDCPTCRHQLIYPHKPTSAEVLTILQSPSYGWITFDITDTARYTDMPELPLDLDFSTLTDSEVHYPVDEMVQYLDINPPTDQRVLIDAAAIGRALVIAANRYRVEVEASRQLTEDQEIDLWNIVKGMYMTIRRLEGRAVKVADLVTAFVHRTLAMLDGGGRDETERESPVGNETDRDVDASLDSEEDREEEEEEDEYDEPPGLSDYDDPIIGNRMVVRLAFVAAWTTLRTDRERRQREVEVPVVGLQELLM